MIAHKHITKIAAGIMALAVCLCLFAMVFSEQLLEAAGGSGLTMEYESRLFDTEEVMQVNILMDEEEWQKMLDGATAETYYQCNIEINGETFYRVGIRPKGNTSLTAIASDPETDRYSLKLEFDQYVDGQTCYGLDKLILNNNYADATNMKEALIYDMYQYLDADSSLYNYAEIFVNGEYWGVYLALEAVEDSFILRNYGTEKGNLYKPESMNMGGMGGGFPMGGSGANLNYTDDDLNSYSAIWDGEVTATKEADHKRVVKALKHISEGNNLETYADVDNLLKYMAVHVFAVNEDSLSGMMAHNYYLYEYDGQLNILPWDYNLSLGGMGGSAADVVNSAIDNAFSGTNFFDTLMENEEYRARYYSYLRQLVDEYMDGGGFETFYNRVRSQIDGMVGTDPTAFYTQEEYLEAVEIFSQVVTLRGESIRGQLEGTIPSTESEQRNSDALVDASGLDLTVMGVMDMGGGGPQRGNSPQNDGNDLQNRRPETADRSTGQTGSTKSGTDVSGSQFGGELSEGFTPPQFGGELPEGFDPPQFGGELPEGFDPSQVPEAPPGNSGLPQNEQRQQEEQSEVGDEESQQESPTDDTGVFRQSGNMKRPEVGGKNMPDMNFGNNTGSSVADTLVWYGISFIVLIGAFLFVKLYRKRRR